MELDKLSFTLELTKKQLEVVKCSDDKDTNSLALGLFANQSFVEVLEYIGGPDYRFHTKQGWETDDKPALVFDIESIIGMIEKIVNENFN